MSDLEAPRAPVQEPALGVSFQAKLDREGARTLVFQTHVEQSIAPSVLNQLLDLFVAATDRQTAKAELAALVAEEQALCLRIDKFTAALAELDVRTQARWTEQGKQGAWSPNKLPPQERSERTNVKNGLDQNREQLVRLRDRVQELRRMVDGDGLVQGMHEVRAD